MSATPRSARLSSPAQVVAILVASALAWLALVGVLLTIFFTVLIPAAQFSGRGEIPADFPVYPGADPQSATAESTGGCTSLQATWSTPDDATKVADYYNRQLANGAWVITSATDGRIDFKSASGPPRSGTVYVRGNEFAGETIIDLTMTIASADPRARCVTGTAG